MILGISIIVIVFSVIFYFVYKDVGLKYAIITFLIAFSGFGAIYLAAYSISNDVNSEESHVCEENK